MLLRISIDNDPRAYKIYFTGQLKRDVSTVKYIASYKNVKCVINHPPTNTNNVYGKVK